MANPNRVLRINFNLLLDKPTDDMLIRIARHEHRSKADVCRRAVRNWYHMAYERNATCADGQRCRCPHAHIYAPTPLVSNPDEDTTPNVAA